MAVCLENSGSMGCARGHCGRTIFGLSQKVFIMTSVTQRIKQIKQPRGGYIPPKLMEVHELEDGQELASSENIHPALMGMVIDYLTRLAGGTPAHEVFTVGLAGARTLGGQDWQTANALADSLVPGEINDASIGAACRLANYDVVRRVGAHMYNPNATVVPDAATMGNIKIMVGRSLDFFEQWGPVVRDGFTFEGGYTDTVLTGDGDFLTHDTLWDFKVSVKGSTNIFTLQLAMYLMLGLRSALANRDQDSGLGVGYNREFLPVRQLGIFNPRLNTIYRLRTIAVSEEIWRAIAETVVGFDFDELMEIEGLVSLN